MTKRSRSNGRPLPEKKTNTGRVRRAKKKAMGIMERKRRLREDEKAEAVQALKTFGIPEREIARYMGITVTELNTHYGLQLNNGKVFANYMVAKALYLNALKGNVRAQEFWLERRAGWVAEAEEVPTPGAGLESTAKVKLIEMLKKKLGEGDSAKKSLNVIEGGKK